MTVSVLFLPTWRTVLMVVLVGLMVPAAGGAATISAQVRQTTSSSVTLAWSSHSGARAYHVLRGRRVIARVSARQRTYRDTSLPAARLLRYRVRAITRQGISQTPYIPAVTQASTACTRFASPNGADANPGTSARPVRTLRRLVATTGAGGVGCARGAFTEALSIETGGRRGRPLTLRAQPGYRAQLNGRLWVARSASDVVIAGMALVGANSTELPSPTINASRVMLLRNDITTRNDGICVLLGSIRGYGAAVDTVVDGNRIHHCGDLPANNHQHGVYLENSLRATITNNVIYANADRGIQLYPNAQSSWIARNVMHGNGQGIIFSGAEGYASSNNQVVDNIITGSLIRSNIEHYWPSGNSIGTGNVAARNCVYGARNDDDIAMPTVGYRLNRNAIRDPRFVNAASADFRLRSTSGCWHAAPLQSVLG